MNLQLVLSRFSMQPDPSWATVWFTPEQVGVWNWERFDNAEYKALHEEGLVENDPAKRDVIYKKMQSLMDESGCCGFHYNLTLDLQNLSAVVEKARERWWRCSAGVSVPK